MKKKIVMLILPLLMISLELLPTGVVMMWAPSPTERVRETVSYFTFLPVGYGMFGPFLAALLSCVLLLLSVLYVWKPNYGLRMALLVVSIFALLGSLMPFLFVLMGDLEQFSATGALISAVILVEVLGSIFWWKGLEEGKER